MKICSKCHIPKEKSDFFGHNQKKDGLRPDCKECFTASRKAYYEANKRRILARQKAYVQANRGRKSATDRLYRQAHKEETRAYQREYKIRNREKLNEKQRERYRNKPHFRIAALLRNRLNFVLNGKRRAQSLLDLLGCSAQEARRYIESQFLPGMSWDNHGKWHIDHRKPLKGPGVDLTDPAQLAELCHYTNLQPLWGPENIRKSNRMAA
jgi:hypothetical protein